MRLAELCDVSQSFIAEMERGNKFPSVVTLEKLSVALKIKPYELFVEQVDLLDSDKQKMLETLVTELRSKVDQEFQDLLDSLK